MKKEIMLFLLNFLLFSEFQLRAMAKKSKFNESDPISTRFNNPNEIRDRLKDGIYKPDLPETWKNRYKKPYNSAWMDYCDPYHCNDYHRLACGLNRKNMRFKWFQSACHLILSNLCARFRGTLKYDIVETKFCTMYVMYLRASCPATCEMEPLDPTCGFSTIDNHAVLFRNKCSLEAANCRQPKRQEYEEANMSVCEYSLIKSLNTRK